MAKLTAGLGTRTDAMTMRVEPETRYFAEIGARAYRTTVSGFIDIVLGEAFGRVEVDTVGDGRRTLKDLRSKLWDVDPEDRVVKLALTCPELLTYQEQKVWKMIRETAVFWRGRWYSEQMEEEVWRVDLEHVRLPTVRRHWPLLQSIANDLADRALLEGLTDDSSDTASNTESGFTAPDDGPPPDDDIPF